MRVAIVLGTRPEIIKMSPIVRELEQKCLDFYILHTGQHYSYNLDQVFFEQLELPQPKYNLGAGSGTHAEETGKMLIRIEGVLMKDRPDVALVEGDTNTVLAGALAAVKISVPVGHVEAGLRSFDREMPEEINRVVADHVSEFLFAPTETSKRNLLSEGISEKKIYVTGNTIVDAIYQNLDLAEKRDEILEDLGLIDDDYFLVTVHRQENVDNKFRFKRIINGLSLVREYFDIPIIYPIHPRSLKRMKQFDLMSDALTLVEPLDYLSFLKLESKAKLIFTDSGGVQEEACILQVPCVTLRYNTERPETIDVGANTLAGADPEAILKCAKVMCDKERDWPNPFGDGRAGRRIVDTLLRKLEGA
jgi:UDP-N-acetylglucosamine 2-epimerase (non-hydrolysing)